MSPREYISKAVKNALNLRRVECRGSRDGGFSIMLRDFEGHGISVYWFADDDSIDEIVRSCQEEWDYYHRTGWYERENAA